MTQRKLDQNFKYFFIQSSVSKAGLIHNQTKLEFNISLDCSYNSSNPSMWRIRIILPRIWSRTIPGRFRSSTNPISKVFLARKGTVPYILVRNSSEKGAFQTNQKWIRIKMKSGKRIRITGILSTRTLNNYVSSPKLFTHDCSIWTF